MRRHLPRLLMTGALLSPVTLYALGLGEIRLNSALNQPFEAEIELISPTRDELSGLQVSLAGADLFTRYGLDRPAYLTGFEFAIARRQDGSATIKVTSPRPVTEPFVTLLVEASWGRGRLLREYTVLLDPPVFMPSQSEAPVAAPQAGARSEGRIERPQPEAASIQAPTPEPVAPAPAQTPVQTPMPARSEAPADYTRSIAAPGGEYTVERNDTLWRIAQQANPGGPSVVNRTMIALFRANPQAFSGNINLLRAGSLLRIPEMAEVEAISSGEASAEVARQAAEWSGALPTAQAQEASRLRLVTPEETPAEPVAAVGSETSADGASGAAIEGTAAAAARDRRLEVANPALAGVQQSGDDTPVAEARPAIEPGGQTEAALQADAKTDDATSDEGIAGETRAAEEPARQAPAAASRAQAPAGPGLLERLSQYWWVPVALGLLVVLGLVLAFIRRRREESESQAAFESLEPALGRDGRGDVSRESARDRLDLNDLKRDDLERDDLGRDDLERDGRAAGVLAMPIALEGAAQPGEDAATAVRGWERSTDTAVQNEAPVTRDRSEAPVSLLDAGEAPAADDTLSSETAVRFDQQDALAEADFHMAYGLYDQAADLVKIAIDREPARRELKLKLLEIYFVWGNKDLFLETARGLHAVRDQAAPGEWDKVLIMGRQIAGDDPMFESEAGAAHVGQVDVNLEGGENRVDVDLFAEPGAGSARQDAPLDLQFDSGEYSSPVHALAPGQADENLDFLLEDEPDRDRADDAIHEIDPRIDGLARTQETPTIESPQLDAPTAEQVAFDSPTIESPAPDVALQPLEETTLGGSVLEAQALQDEEPGRGLGDVDPDATMLAPSFAAEFARGDGEVDRGAQTIREQLDKTIPAGGTIDQTAELSIDDLGLDVDALAPSTLEDTTSLERDALAAFDEQPEQQTQEFAPLSDDELTQLAPSISSFDRTLEAPRVAQGDVEETGTIYLDGVVDDGGDGPADGLIESLEDGLGDDGIDAPADGAGESDTVEQRRPDVDTDATASMKMPEDLADLADASRELGLDLDLDLDLDAQADADTSDGGDTVEQRRPDAEADRFSSDVFAEHTAQVPQIDLDVGEALINDDNAPTNRQSSTELLELSELDPVTMSEVGTKLDLARAYMDMGDPDGARSILDEVVMEGNPGQKQEAQRLLDSIR